MQVLLEEDLIQLSMLDAKSLDHLQEVEVAMTEAKDKVSSSRS